ncbi:hypothetical protein [Bacteroides uniformis]|uniref:hypothetical protein n=1 Tax=Bacteroides uniformis TaxID=820 RepID=UPI001F008D9C|nr:hypothetical protein [Bacteroides uniformis]
MNRHNNYRTNGRDEGLPLQGGSSCFQSIRKEGRMTETGEKPKDNRAIHVPMNYRAKVVNASFRQARSGLAVSREKSSSPAAPVFFPKTLPAGSIHLYRPIVQRDMQSPEYSQLK